MAASHSGSTLTAMLLGAHPQATTIGDTAGTVLRKDPEYHCSCGQKANDCPFWQQVRGQMESRGFPIDVADFETRFEHSTNRFLDRVLHAEHRGLLLESVRDVVLRLSREWPKRFDTIAERNVALVETVTTITNSDVLIDSSKLPHRLKFLLRVPKLEIKVIHLVRDGRGVAHTCIQDDGWTAEKSAIEWQRGNLAAERLLAGLDRDQWVRIRYEDLCSDPHGQLQKLCVFLGLNPDQVNLDFRSAGLHVFGNRMRLSSERAVRLDTRWQTELSNEQISTIERLAGKQLEQYGYEFNKSHRS